jgi:hypothetical protein
MCRLAWDEVTAESTDLNDSPHLAQCAGLLVAARNTDRRSLNWGILGTSYPYYLHLAFLAGPLCNCDGIDKSVLFRWVGVG